MKLVALFLLLIILSFSTEVAIGFGELTPDEEIIKLLERCNAKVRALWYATPYGTGGSGSKRDWHEPRKLFAKIRNELAYMDKTAYFDSTISFRIILEYNLLKPEDLVKYPKLLKFIRGLVNNYYQQKETYFYIKNGGPIVYAVLAKTDNVECIEKSKLVKDISVNYFRLFTTFLKYVPYYFRPKKYSKYYFFPKVKNAKPEELYRMMQRAVNELQKDKEFLKYYEENYLNKYYKGENFYQLRLRFLKKSIEHKKKLSLESSRLKTPPTPTYFRDGNPYLNCPTNSLTLKTCEFRRFFHYGSAWSGKYDCTPAGWCD